MHWHLLLSDFAYGKDIRLYRAVRWVIGKFWVVQREGEELVHQINRKTIRYAIARVIVDVIRDGDSLFSSFGTYGKVGSMLAFL